MADADINRAVPESVAVAPEEKSDRASLVEIKNGKLVFKQKPMSFEKMSETMQDIVRFREMLEQKVETKAHPLSAIPDEHKPVVAKLVHESIHQAKVDLLSLFQTLPESERNAIVGPKPSAKIPVHKFKAQPKEIIVIDATEAVTNSYKNAQPSSQPKQEISEGVNSTEGVDRQSEVESSPSKNGRPKKVLDPEKLAKEKERQEKRLARAEREKKAQEAQDKSRSLMASFFGKTKAASSFGSDGRASSIPKDKEVTSTSGGHEISNIAGPSNITHSEFEKTFRPFMVKKDAELAPINKFRERKKGKKVKENGLVSTDMDIIVIDDDGDEQVEDEDEDIQMMDVAPSNHDFGQLTAEDRLRDAISSFPPTFPLPHHARQTHAEFKSYHNEPIRSLIAQLNEAEIVGDDSAVRSILSRLRSRRRVPAKVLIFADDARPGYFGTWTRNSREVGPRTPFARDVVSLDYTYDSGEEWEEESGEADDVVEDAEDEEVAAEEVDSDLDSWLVDDDEGVEPGTPIEDRAGSPFEFPVPPPEQPKRKSNEGDPKMNKKRKVVVPLVPFIKGTCWESTIGQCDYEPFNAYRIQLLNDTPFPINPFTFVSIPVDEKPPVPTTTQSHPDSRSFAVPALPERLQVPPSAAATSSSGPSVFNIKKRPVVQPKTPFPDAHIPLLLSKIGSLESGSLTFIVETVYKELSEFKVKKNAIEAKVKEIGEKSREGKKLWVIKPEVKALYQV
ncbi:hypothetical protein EW026_g3635 [Hermanssonia centrifuga]|uniref:Chromatin assembly factor 1 subunit A dimerization domain-containing protein n=1 Tax=Hermanssonia centrifuga TaxID=98765 RepID=A0A4V3XAL2_9APHY|nr:hypothetical protein EW026_g3635 [Hermanssonia centrifuga]